MDIELEQGARLIEWPAESGKLWIAVGTEIYARYDRLPLEGRPFASEFVANCMGRAGGLPVAWPQAAIEFVFPIEEDYKRMAARARRPPLSRLLSLILPQRPAAPR